MRKLTLILSLMFTVTLSSPSHAEWTKVSENVSGDTFYVDFERIKKHDGFVYFLGLYDYLKTNKYGNLSDKVSHQGDCKLFRIKFLSVSHHKEPMGGGTGETPPVPKQLDWMDPPPNTPFETILKSVCSR